MARSHPDNRKRFLVLLVISAALAAATAAVSISVLYQAAFEERRTSLLQLVRSQARMIESIARFNASTMADTPPRAAATTAVVQILEAFRKSGGFGESGDFLLGRREGDSIVFLANQRHGRTEPLPVPFDSHLAAPMRQALLGRSGTISGLDHAGVAVLAAHEPVALLEWGLVAKIDLAEIRAPFVKAGVLSAAAALLLIALGTLLFRYLGTPLVGQLDAASATSAEGTGLGLPLTKGLVEAHGGTLAIDTVPGAGTTATVRLPPERVMA